MDRLSERDARGSQWIQAQFHDRVRACLMGAITGDPELAEDLLRCAGCIVTTGGQDAEALRNAGLAVAPPAGPSGLVVRTLAYGLLTHLDRPRVRQGAYRCATLAGINDGAAAAGMATAILAADLVRGLDLDTCLMRCHQTLLEEAPMALLTRLRPLPDEAAPDIETDEDPNLAIQLALTALHRGQGVDAVVAAFGEKGHNNYRVAPLLAAALAGIRDGFNGFDVAALDNHPLRERAEHAAEALVTAVLSASPARG